MSPTEDVISELVASYLSGEGISAETQGSTSTPGTRSQPDFRVSDGDTVLGVAAWDDEKWAGFGEARDYGRLPGMDGAFLIAYPDELRRSGGQIRLRDGAEPVLDGYECSCAFLRRGEPTDVVSLELAEIPDWLRSNIERRRTPEPDPGEVVGVLRQTARALTRELQTAPDENVFRNVLGATPDEEDEREAAREAAGFLLVNQLTFYRILSSTDRFPGIDPAVLSSPGDLGAYFDRVQEVDHTPVFSFRIADDLPRESLTVLKDAIATIDALTPENVDHDVLGTVFHELIPIEARKQVAAFYTMNRPASLVADLCIGDPDDRVMDPACGSGTMLVSAYNRKKELSPDWTEETHRQFVEEELTGVDVMPFAAHLSSLHLALQAPTYGTDDVRVGVEDSTKLHPGSSVSPPSFVRPESESLRSTVEYEGGLSLDVTDDSVEGGNVSVDAAGARGMELGTVDVVMMNPPFTRQESVAGFAEGYKSRLRDRFSRRDRRGQVHGKMSYSSYFVFLADRFLEEGGRIAAVLPASVLNKSSDAGIRDMLLNEYELEYLLAREDGSNFSEDTDIREVIVVARKGAREDGGSVACVAFDGLDVDGTDVDRAAEDLREEDPGETRRVAGRNDSEASVWRVPYDELVEHNLFSTFSVHERGLLGRWYEIASRDGKLGRVGELDAGLTRGGSSHPWTKGTLAAPDTHVRPGDVWVVRQDGDPLTVEHRPTNDVVEIPRSVVEPYVLRKPYRTTVDVSGIPEYTVVRPFERSERFLSLAEADRIPDGWEDHVTENAAHVAIPETIKLTAPGTRHPVYYSDEPRIFHRMWMHTGFDREEARLHALWFDSTIGLLQFFVSRVPVEGAWSKFRRYSQSGFYTFDPEALTGEDTERLAHVWEEWNDVECPEFAEQLARLADPDRLSDENVRRVERQYGVGDRIGEGFPERRALDEAMLDVLDAGSDELLEELYRGLLLELVELKEMGR